MSRRRRVIHKIESLDSRYGSPVVARLISTVMRSGKKAVAERIVYEAIERSREGSDSVDPLDTLHKALENALGTPREVRALGNLAEACLSSLVPDHEMPVDRQHIRSMAEFFGLRLDKASEEQGPTR